MSHGSGSLGLPFKKTKQLIKAIDSIQELLQDLDANSE